MDDDTLAPAGPDGPHDNPLRNVPIEITVSVGRARPSVGDLLSLGEGAVLPLDRRIEDPVELWVGDKLIARGELQELDGGEAGQLGKHPAWAARGQRARSQSISMSSRRFSIPKGEKAVTLSSLGP